MHTRTDLAFTLEAIEQHRFWLTVRATSPNTIRAYTSDLHLFMQANPKVHGMEIDDQNLEIEAMLWLNEGRKTWKPRTTQRRRTALRSMGKFLGNANFLADYRAPSVIPGGAHPLPGGIDAVDTMIDAAVGHDHKALIVLCGRVGLRVNEAVTVGPDDYDPRYATLRVFGKGAKERTVPLSERARPYVALAAGAALLDGRTTLVGLAERTAREVVTRIGKRAGLGHVASHDLRMTFGTEAYNKTKDLRVVQDLLGHASSRTTEGYTGVSMASMREAVDF